MKSNANYPKGAVESYKESFDPLVNFFDSRAKLLGKVLGKEKLKLGNLVDTSIKMAMLLSLFYVDGQRIKDPRKEIKTYLKKHFHIKVKEEGIVPMGSLENIPEEIKAKPIINKGDENFGKTIEEFVLADPNPNYLARKGHGLFNKPDYYIVKVTEGRGKKVLNAKKVKSF